MSNTVYKLWLGKSLLGKSCGFSKASFYLERFVPKNATAHIPNVTQHLRKTTLHIIILLSILIVSCKKEAKTDKKTVDKKTELKTEKVDTLKKIKTEPKKKLKKKVSIDTLIIQNDTLFIEEHYFLKKEETYAKCKGKLNEVEIYFIGKTSPNSDYSYCIGTNPKRNKENENNLTIVLLKLDKVVYELDLNNFISPSYNMYLKNASDIILNEVDETIELNYYQAFCGGVQSTLYFFRKDNKLIKGIEVSQFSEPETEFFYQTVKSPKNKNLNQIWIENKVGTSYFENIEYKEIVYFTDIEKYNLQNDSLIKLNPKIDNFYYVTAKSGLRQRTEPSVHSDTLELLPYKTKVNVLNETDIKIDLYDDGKLIKGRWMRIKYENQFIPGLSSYVFDGFLSKNKPKE